MKPLAGCSVWVTRPLDVAEGVCKAIEAQGGAVLAYPTLVIQPCVLSVQSVAEAIQKCDQIIFTSQSAVQLFPVSLLPELVLAQERIKILAIGQATASFLKKQGVPVYFVPQRVGSEGLLQEASSLQKIEGQTILLITGKDGLSLLSKTLQARSAIVIQIDTYFRQAPPTFQDWPAWQSCQSVIIGSLAALQYAYACLPTPKSKQWLQSLTVFVGSPRLQQEVLKQYPKQYVQLAKTPYDADIMEALVKWWHDMPK